MNAVLQAFDFESLAVRVIVREEQPWFIAADVCRALDLENPRKVCADLDADEVLVLTRSEMTVTTGYGHSQRGGAQFFNLISESGLYALIFKSRKPEARRFRKWVTSEVLPAIRRDGEYRVAKAVAATERGQLARLRKLLLETAEAVKAGTLTPGKAQAIAITGQRYLETLKLEAEAMGYEKVLGLSNGETGDGILPDNGDAANELLQGLSQREMREAGEELPDEEGAAIRSQETLGGGAPGTGSRPREGGETAGESSAVDFGTGARAAAGVRGPD